MASEKDIRYLNKDFDGFKRDLELYAKSYFPTIHKDFSEASPGTLFMDMGAYVGDVLSFYLETQLKEFFFDTATERGNMYELAQNYNYRPKGRTSAFVDVTLSHEVPAKLVNGEYVPDLDYALTVDAGAVIRSSENTNIEFRTIEPVDFRTNNDPNNPREDVIVAFDATNNPTFFRLSKKARAKSGKTKKTTFTFGNPIAYDKAVIEDNNIVDITKVVDSDDNIWYEVENLAQDTVFLSVPNEARFDPDSSADKDETPYLLKEQLVTRRFVTKLRDDNTLEMQFGAGVSSTADGDLVPNLENVRVINSDFERGIDDPTDPSQFMRTATYGLAPNNTTLTVTYTTSIGLLENASVNTLTDIISSTTTIEDKDLDNSLVSKARTSLTANNEEAAVGARNFEDLEEIRINALASYNAQNRAVTKDDYLARVYALPSRYGSIAKAHIEQDNASGENSGLSLNLYVLAYNNLGQFTTANQALKENLKTYIQRYKMLSDAINIRDAFIINYTLSYEVVLRANAQQEETLALINQRIAKFLGRGAARIKASINLSELKAEMALVPGVQYIKTVTLKNITTEGYSQTQFDFESATVDDIVAPGLDPAVFEIKFPDVDIKGTVV